MEIYHYKERPSLKHCRQEHAFPKTGLLCSYVVDTLPAVRLGYLFMGPRDYDEYKAIKHALD